MTSPTRIDLARDLARIRGAIESVSLDAHLAQFATPAELDAFRAGLAVAMDEVSKAEAVLHDMWLDAGPKPICDGEFAGPAACVCGHPERHG